MNKYKIAITGGIGSGKSTVINYLHEKNYPVFSCDEINSKLYLDNDYINKIKESFPKAVDEHNNIDKKILSKIVFNNNESLIKLNSITHPIIMKKLINEMNNSDSELVFAEVPLLFEGGFDRLFDKIIVVIRDENERINSVMARDSLSKNEVISRINSQFDYNKLDLKNEKFIIIYNNKDYLSLKKSIESKLKNLK